MRILSAGLLLGLAAWLATSAPSKPPEAVNDWSQDEFQFRFGLSPGERNIYLYIPPKAKRVRALFLLQQNVSEQMIAVHPAIRQVCDANDVAIAWCFPGIWNVFDVTESGRFHQQIQEGFGRFGRSIGYPELGEVPLITFGHSATNSYCQNAAEGRPDRVLAVLATHGWNGVDTFRRYKGPVLLFIGSYWEQRQQRKTIRINKGIPSLAKMRRKLAENWMPISVVDEYGSGHFDYSDAIVEVFALFLEKAVKARLGPDGRLQDIDPNTGTIADIPSLPLGPIPVKPYQEATEQERARAVWFFDRELAEAAVRVISGNGPWNRAPQFIGFTLPDGTLAPFGKGGLVDPLPYQIVPGTNELKVFPVLLRTIPEGFLEAGQPLAVSSDPTITLEYVSGPYVHLDRQGKYRVKLNRGGRFGYLVARNRGDAHCRPTVQPAVFRLRGDGAPPPLENPGDQKPGAIIPLKQSQMPKEYLGYYVDHGPARVLEGNRLQILPVPANCRQPLEVELVAYRLGPEVLSSASVRFFVHQ